MKLSMEPVNQVFQIPGGGVLRFNPTDPALFLRLEQLQTRVEKLNEENPEKLDKALKKLLSEALGPGNDLHSALGGVSLFALTKSGKTVLENLLTALGPVLREGAEQCAENC